MNIVRAALLLIVLQYLSLDAWAQDTSQSNLEHHIKAVFLYKFPTYIEWPLSAFEKDDDPFTIGIMGAEEIAKELLKISEKKRVNDRPVQVKHIDPEDTFDNLHILFIGRQESERLQSLLSSLQSKPILTVTESSGALEAGSVINFLLINRNIRFEISTTSADSKGVRISSRLLDIAHRVESGK